MAIDYRKLFVQVPVEEAPLFTKNAAAISGRSWKWFVVPEFTDTNNVVGAGSNQKFAPAIWIKGSKISTGEGIAADIASLQTAIGNLQNYVGNNGTKPADSKTIAAAIADLEKTIVGEEGTDGLVDRVEALEDATIEVSSSDKVLGTDANGALTSAFTFEYSSTDKKIYLYGKDKTADNKIGEVDCTSFIKDGMLDSVDLVDANDAGTAGKFLKITWNTDANKTVTYVDVADLFNEYTVNANSTNYLGITSNQIEFKINAVLAAIREDLGLKNYTQAEADAENANHYVADTSGNEPGTEGYTPTYEEGYTPVTTSDINPNSSYFGKEIKAVDAKVSALAGRVTTLEDYEANLLHNVWQVYSSTSPEASESDAWSPSNV